MRPPATIRRVAYLGSPEMAVPPLVALHESGFDIALVVTNPDRRRGRGRATTPTPVKAAALDRDIPVSHDVDDVLAAGVDLGVVVAFGQIIQPHVLDAVPMVNLHFSLLPRWRGAAPVERAILAGDTETGVDLMVVEEGLDTGAVYARRRLTIGESETADELRERLVETGTALLTRTLADGLAEPAPQAGEPTYAAKLTTDDLRIDWDESTDLVMRRIRLGGAWTTLDGERFKVWRARPVGGPDGVTDGVAHPVGDGWVELLEVQPAGKARMSATAWANGARWLRGDRLGT